MNFDKINDNEKNKLIHQINNGFFNNEQLYNIYSNHYLHMTNENFNVDLRIKYHEICIVILKVLLN
ncbi:hypothetical protein, partial [Kordia sp.]|uniref:hypothetical protein n=1 Tax=Kordia sp. TaxID=1965332 RepID=UPI003D6B0646